MSSGLHARWRSHLTPAASSGNDALICTVSTVFDTPENVELFVSRNLAAGVDHMFVFLDRRQPRVHRYLQHHPNTTPVVTDKEYWAGRRPKSLNTRQTVNANLVRTLLAPLPWAAWLFHLDADECPEMDRDRLLGLEPEIRVVSLQTMEALSVADGETQTRFKRQLSKEELALLHLLGGVSRPDNAAYFNGHAHGKAGIRPTLDFNLHIHRARELDGTVIEPYTADDMRLLHYDSVSLEAFVHKWTTHAAAEQDSVFGPRRAAILAAVRAVQRNPALDEEGRARFLRRIYERTVQDDAGLLDELGFVVAPDPLLHRHRPSALSDSASASMHRLLRLLCEANKDYFRPGRPGRPADLLAQAAAALRDQDPDLVDAVDRCVGAAAPQPV